MKKVLVMLTVLLSGLVSTQTNAQEGWGDQRNGYPNYYGNESFMFGSGVYTGFEPYQGYQQNDDASTWISSSGDSDENPEASINITSYPRPRDHQHVRRAYPANNNAGRSLLEEDLPRYIYIPE